MFDALIHQYDVINIERNGNSMLLKCTVCYTRKPTLRIETISVTTKATGNQRQGDDIKHVIIKCSHAAASLSPLIIHVPVVISKFDSTRLSSFWVPLRWDFRPSQLNKPDTSTVCTIPTCNWVCLENNGSNARLFIGSSLHRNETKLGPI